MACVVHELCSQRSVLSFIERLKVQNFLLIFSPSLSLSSLQWSLRLDPNDRPTCSQLLRHELFSKSSWSDQFIAELRRKVEKELEENPLLRSLGIPIHGSVHDAKSKPKAEPLPAGNGQMPPSKKAAVSWVGLGYWGWEELKML